ncbi:putative FK506-binding protein 4 [Amylocarpus encephaloides]|uniref:peptidylprolyl isomerase n=1 Tax=Amylocarpus encephaloides TaxID=45428 RepID=A0A9P7YSY3_9HELO|nr:putative FK506-binding protein 4 [Amylocarpus encephaloides]
MPLIPVALYGREVPCGDVPIPAFDEDFRASFRITMAAINPSESPVIEEGDKTTIPRATLKIIRTQEDEEDDEDDEEMSDELRALLAQSDSDESESEEEANGGPSDPTKSKKARKEAALKQLMESLKEDGSDEEMGDATNGTNGTKASKKGKSKATNEDEEDSEDSDEGEDIEVEEFVLCTLDPEKHYQQTLDITVGERETVYFQVTGTHNVYLTGNILIPDDDGHNHHHEVYDSDSEEDEDDYDLSPNEDELELMMDGEESDDLDDLEDPRITEVDSEEEPPKLIAKPSKVDKKGAKKRTADEIEEAASLDDIMAKSIAEGSPEEPKLSKKQLKKLKKNNGEAAAVQVDETKKVDDASSKSDKKVQFAKNLEQGPTGSAEKAKPEKAGKAKADSAPSKEASGKATLGVKTVQGVKLDDKKLGKGAACKKGDKVGMRYIGKLLDGKVFDSNKSGKPFPFKLGAGEVIKGWDIGVAGMSIGGERRITIPPKQAYGSQKIPGIPPNSTLVFDVKLLEIK